ncbi:YceI family protein [Anaeromyxobacter paludicola]|uniref:Polyisoprenoid-binding protein n=1 Tax=Anaeromyxobacter paludicola TaxID=2918171 RepID=A0ABM7XEE7_9BACT|nr:YceI family protein [Anaeromyxobacter paludicola]BDG10257.1 polyisoprenoid-binding protein [Anaeromyxobacter paludicola]
MKRFASLLAALAFPALAGAATWEIDPAHSSTSFSVKHLVITTVRGVFGKTTGTVELDEKSPARSKVEATVDATTIDTRVKQRDDDLKSSNFLDVEKFPTIAFKSTQVRAAGKGKLEVTGDLTLHGVTKPVTFHVTGPSGTVKGMQGELRRSASATARINRHDFGLNYSKAIEAGPVVGDTVDLQIDAELVQKPPAGAASSEK